MEMLTASDLHGSWLLREWRIEYPDGRPATTPFGPDPVGVLIYAPDGWMSATMSWRRRTPLSAVSALKADDRSKAAAFQEYLAYSGRWRLDGQRIAHDVQMSMNPSLVGTCQYRDATLRDGILTLGAAESIGAGQQRQHSIVWRRA